MADWVVISSLATAGGTLALAATTYASVRSANRAARVAEMSLMAGLRPLLVESTESDPVLRVDFHDVGGIAVPGGRAAVEVLDGGVYLVVSLRNVGAGIAVLHGGAVRPESRLGGAEHTALEEFTFLTRDIYIPPGKIGFWQIAFRDEGPTRDALLGRVEAGAIAFDVLYGDYEGGQRVISRFRARREQDGAWHLATLRHWQLDRDEPRARG